MRVSTSQRACCDSVQPISSQSMRATSGLARAQMISPARCVLTAHAPEYEAFKKLSREWPAFSWTPKG
jgi:hypothetical protein